MAICRRRLRAYQLSPSEALRSAALRVEVASAAFGWCLLHHRARSVGQRTAVGIYQGAEVGGFALHRSSMLSSALTSLICGLYPAFSGTGTDFFGSSIDIGLVRWRMPTAAISALSIEKLTPVIGAVATGVDLRRALDPQLIGALRSAWYQHTILLVRGQDISEEEQVRFGEYFGVLGKVMKSAPAWPIIIRP